MYAFLTTRPPMECTTKMRGSFPILSDWTSESLPNFICIRRSLAKSDMLKVSLFGDMK